MKTQILPKQFTLKALMLAVLFLLFSVNFSYAQSGWFTVRSDTLIRWQWNYFTNSNTGYTVGSKFISSVFWPKILKTTNAGSHWQEQMHPLRDSANWLLRCVYFTDANTGFVTATNVTNTNSGRILKTTDGGNNWSIVPLPVDKNMSMIFFVNSSTGYASGHSTILKTTDAGVTWITQNPNFLLYLFGIHFTNVNTGYIVGNAGTILKTTNGGNNWINLGAPTVMSISGVYFINAETGIVAGGSDNNTQNIILRTTNAGNNWTQINYTSSTCLLWSVRFISPTTGYIIGWCGQVLKTTNGGLNWNNQSLPVPADEFWGRSCFFTSADTGYLVGQPNNISGFYSYIFKTTTGGIPTGIKPVSNDVPTEFKMEQNYPNPFNQSTMFKFQCSMAGVVQLKVFDLLGREVAVLVNEKLQPGTYEVSFDALNLPSGVYFYKLTAGEFEDTKKLVLMK